MKTRYYLFILSMCVIVGYGIFSTWAYSILNQQSVNAWRHEYHNHEPELWLTLRTKKDSRQIEMMKVSGKTEKITYPYNQYIQLSYIVTFPDVGVDSYECEIQKELNICGLSLKIGGPETVSRGVCIE